MINRFVGSFSFASLMYGIAYLIQLNKPSEIFLAGVASLFLMIGFIFAYLGGKKYDSSNHAMLGNVILSTINFGCIYGFYIIPEKYILGGIALATFIFYVLAGYSSEEIDETEREFNVASALGTAVIVSLLLTGVVYIFHLSPLPPTFFKLAAIWTVLMLSAITNFNEKKYSFNPAPSTIFKITFLHSAVVLASVAFLYHLPNKYLWVGTILWTLALYFEDYITFRISTADVDGQTDERPNNKLRIAYSIFLSILISGTIYWYHNLSISFSVTLALVSFAVVYLLIGLFTKREDNKPAREQTVAEKSISTYEVVEVNDSMSPLEKWTVAIRNYAHALYNAQLFNDEAIALWKIAEESERPLLVLVMGEFKTGKSTFINTILKENILTTDAAPATAVVTLLTYGEKKSAVIHYFDGTTENYDVEKLSEITAEGDESKEELRNRIEFVELSYPNELLKKIEIVDTPGLNVHKQSHINSTENFQSRADLVLWVFNAARMATRSEVEEIERLGQRLKPLAIVNRIDNIDEDEETVDEVLQKVRKKLGDNVSDVIGISAGQAHKAISTNDTALLEESRWQIFMDRMQSQIAAQAEPLKIKSICDKIIEFCTLLENSVLNKERELGTKEKYFSSSEEATKTFNIIIKNLSDAISFCDNQIATLNYIHQRYNVRFSNISYGTLPDDGMNFLVDELNALRCLVPFKEFLPPSETAKKFIHDIEVYEYQYDQEDSKIKGLLNQITYLTEERRALAAKKVEVEAAEYDYKHSGIFGGEPIFDFSGKRARFNRLVDEYNSSLQRFENKRVEFCSQATNMIAHLSNVCDEVKNLAVKIEKFLMDELRTAQKELENVTKNFEREQKQYQQDCRNVRYGRTLLEELRKNLN